jgi:hypothetical protein
MTQMLWTASFRNVITVWRRFRLFLVDCIPGFVQIRMQDLTDIFAGLAYFAHELPEKADNR